MNRLTYRTVALLALAAVPAMADDTFRLLIAEGQAVTDGSLIATGSNVNSWVRASGTDGWVSAVTTTNTPDSLSRLYGNNPSGLNNAITTKGTLRTEQTVGPYTQSAFLTAGVTFGDIDANGRLAYVATLTGTAAGASIWLDSTPLAVLGQAVPNVPSVTYTALSAPVVGTGAAYWYGSFNNGATRTGLFKYDGTSSSKVLASGVGDTVGGFSVDGVTFGVNTSNNGTRYITDTTLGGSRAIVADGALLTTTSGGTYRTGSTIGTASGGVAGENFNLFATYYNINDSGSTLVTATTAGTAASQVLLINGQVVLRRGQQIGTLNSNTVDTIAASLAGTDLNNAGDWAVTWDVATPAGSATTDVEVAIVNGLIIAKAGTAALVDLTGDGIADPGLTWNNISKIAIGERMTNGQFNVYITGGVVGTLPSGYVADADDAVFVVTVPEPTFVAAAGALGGLVLARRRRAVK